MAIKDSINPADFLNQGLINFWKKHQKEIEKKTEEKLEENMPNDHPTTNNRKKTIGGITIPIESFG